MKREKVPQFFIRHFSFFTSNEVPLSRWLTPPIVLGGVSEESVSNHISIDLIGYVLYNIAYQ
ncbi:MAG: hypothetical protein IKR48_11065 [Kiritimatiellae bacterium]|nr:hypothetical protein [Kiritimatiellia bacterium]